MGAETAHTALATTHLPKKGPVMVATHITAAEVWKPVVGYEGWYSASSLGRIRRDKTWNGTTAGLILKPQLQRNQYLRVYLWKNGNGRFVSVHRIVASAFHGRPESRMFVNHKNGDRTDNRPENLEWCTPAENSRHADVVLGKCYRGEKNRNAKLSDAQVVEIRQLLVNGHSGPSIAKRFGIAHSHVYRIKHGQSR